MNPICRSPDDLFRQVPNLSKSVKITCTRAFAHGGYSDIWRGICWDENLISDVAIKITRTIARGDVATQRLKTRIAREVIAWSQAQHKNILPLYGLYWAPDDTTNALPAIVLPYCAAGTCTEYIKRHPAVDRVEITCQVADALVYLHSLPRPVVHGDIKSANVLMTDDGIPLLADFGLSRIVAESSTGLTTSSSRGAYRWMAPELFGGVEDQIQVLATTASDVWAFGCLCIEIFAGQLPWAAIKHDTLVMKAIAIDRRQPSLGLSFESGILMDTLGRCWTYEPSKRPSMSEGSLLRMRRYRNQYTREIIMHWPPTWKVVEYWVNGREYTQTEYNRNRLQSAAQDIPTVSNTMAVIEIIPQLEGDSVIYIKDESVQSTIKNIAREIYVWSRLKHENILNLTGLAMFQEDFSIVSPWMENGTLLQYVSRRPEVNRYNLCLQITAGLQYLHSSGVIHGDLKGVVKLTDFGNTLLKKYSTLIFTGVRDNSAISVRWASPELLAEGGEHTEKSDVYALAMTFLEAITGQVPFPGKSETVALAMTLDKKMPERPEFFSWRDPFEAETLWTIMTYCWHPDPVERPNASQTEDVSRAAPQENVILRISSAMDAPTIISVLCKKDCRDVTAELDKDGPNTVLIAGGGFGDIYRGTLRNGSKVAIKCRRLFLKNDDDGRNTLKNIARETYVWSKLRHPCILSLIGLATFRDQVSMVSPWMENGTLPEYIARHPGENRFDLCRNIAFGLRYLHMNGVVHGDLKGSNILISEDGNPKLADFGNTVMNKCTLEFTGTSGSSGISMRWAAPELIIEGGAPTQASDIYSLGMTFLETITGQIPFSDKSDLGVVSMLMLKKTPERPEKPTTMRDWESEVLWHAMYSCWEYNPADRPEISRVIDIIYPGLQQRVSDLTEYFSMDEDEWSPIDPRPVLEEP
ncbi:Tyrosine kinase catalytic domain protein [Ceratobasidium sp. AG-Ba]|nr:Tyrosine kinase catalytic domain protein [Ceratobasidium sp. AG-Ba]